MRSFDRIGPALVRTTLAALVAAAMWSAARGAPPKAEATPDPRYIPQGENMLANGDFAKGDDFPEGWEPMSPGVEYLDLGGERGKAIHFEVEREVARTTGLKYWSDYIPVKPNRTYTFNFDCKKSGGVNLKVFLKGYMEHRGRRREIYRAPVHVYFKGDGDWERHGRREAFSTAHPSGRKVQWVRFMLYAYGSGKGEAWWDNFHMQEIEVSPEDDL